SATASESIASESTGGLRLSCASTVAGRDAMAPASMSAAPHFMSHPREEKLAEEADQHPRWSLDLRCRLAVDVGCAGDVDVRPWQSFGELAEEPTGRDASGGPPSGVLHVCDVRLDQVAELVVQRQFPEALVGHFARAPQRVDQRCTRT